MFGGFQFWVITNKAVVNIHIHNSEPWLCFLLDKYLGVEWLDGVVGVCLTL